MTQEDRAEKRQNWAAALSQKSDPEGWFGPHCMRPLSTPLGKKEGQTLLGHAGPDEVPWLLLVTTYGVLAGFEDRVVIVKTGGVNGLVAGALFGGREAVISLSDITGVEYNSDFLQGWLEVLSPSYMRSATGNKSRNRRAHRDAANSPWSLPNTLLLTNGEYRKTAPALQELRRRITDANRPHLGNMNSAMGLVPTSLAEQLASLASLRKEGLLTQAEFDSAKARLLP